MRRDSRVFLIGEDVRQGIFGGYNGLWKEFGNWRVINTPISESAFIGASLGAAITGMRPVVDIMFSDFITVGMDQIFNQTAKMRYMTGGKVKIPIVIRTPSGAGLSAAAHHSSTVYSWFVNMPGLKVVTPSTPYDIKGLLKTAIRDDNPVVVFELKNQNIPAEQFRAWSMIPEEEYLVPFGQADVKREGEDVTIVPILAMVLPTLSAAETLEKEGISAEVVDPRTLVPFDKKRVTDSIRKTGRLVIVDEAPRTGGAAAEIAALIAEEAFDYLDAPIKRITTLDTPIPFSPLLEKYVMPDKNKITRAVHEII